MRVKIGNKIYSDADEPIMVVLTNEDKFNLLYMPEDKFKYASAPDGYFDSVDDFLKWMNEELKP